MHEYFDRGLPSANKKLHPASNEQQRCFDMARSSFTEALSAEMDTILQLCPEIRIAYGVMNNVLANHPTRAFKVFRPEDASMTIDADSNTAFVR